jgi:hypothetical protein
VASFEPSPQPTNVPGPGGAVASISIPEGFRHRRIHGVIVQKVAGSATTFNANVSTDPTFANATNHVVRMTGGNGNHLHYDNQGNGYEWDWRDSDDGDGTSLLYVQLTPDQGSDNDFLIRVLIHRGLP